MIRASAASIRWYAGALVLSFTGHALSVASLPPGITSMRRPPPSRVDLVELVFEPQAPEPVVPQPRVVPPSTPQTLTPRPDRETPTETQTDTQTPASAPALVATVPSVTPVMTATDGESPHVVPNPTHPRIDPRHAALTVLETDGPRMPRAAAAEPDVETPAARDARLARELNSTLAVAANARPEGFGPRELPPPQRRPNGTLAYALGQVTAIVNPDGSFTFDDTSGVHFDGMGSADRQGGMQASFGLEEWMMRRHGNDPHAATRRWFANQTQEMRDGMEQRYVERMAAREATRARARMDRILADEAVAIEVRRRRIFEAWNDCAEGELVGDAVRAAIVTYVRLNLANGSENAFPESELDALNRGRTGTSEFRPYAP